MPRTPPTRWCHLTWSTARHHKFFNIAALARFCERTLVQECARRGWRGDVAVLPDRVHVLLQVPAHVTRDQLIRTVRGAAAEITKRAGAARGGQRVWENSCWMSVVTNGAAVEALRRKIRAINTAGIGCQVPGVRGQGPGIGSVKPAPLTPDP